jgi:hypothetical protein
LQGSSCHPPVFDDDTFQSDALKHILSLLRSFDKYGFTLITSLCLSNTRSRVKDLWIFSTPEVDSDTIVPSSILTAGGGYTPGNTVKLPGSQTSLLRPPGHLRSASEQPVTLSPSHTRNASVPPLNTTPKSGNTLLKKSPRPGADKLPPVSDNSPPSSSPYYGTVSKSAPSKPLAPPLRTNIPPQILYATPTPASEEAGGPPPELFYSSSPSQPPPPLPRGTLYVANGGPDETDSITAPPPPLLSANAFRDTSIGHGSQGDGEALRDSEFSTLSDNSMDIPLAWTGGLPTTMEEEDPSSGRESGGQSYAQTNRDSPSTPETNLEDRAFSPNPMVPGSWVDNEGPNERLQGRPAQQRTSLPPPRPINLPTKIEHSTTASPQVVGDSTPQKSRPAISRDSADAELTRGWVLVNAIASPGFDSRTFDGGRYATDPMSSLPALPTPGVETPYSNDAPTAPPIAPKPKPKPKPHPPAHVKFSTSGSGGGGGGGGGSGVEASLAFR